MKTGLSVALCVLGLALTGGASTGRFSVGMEIVPLIPEATLTLITGGLDAEWLTATFGAGFPVSVPVPTVGVLTLTSYMVSVGPALYLAPGARVRGGFAHWWHMLDIVSYCPVTPRLRSTVNHWSGWVGMDWRMIQASFPGWGAAFSVFGSVHQPVPTYTATPHIPWVTMGVSFVFGPHPVVDASP